MPDIASQTSAKLVLGPHCAAVLPGVVWVVLDVMGLDVLGIELQHFGAVMIDEDNCVLERHGEVSFTRTGTRNGKRKRGLRSVDPLSGSVANSHVIDDVLHAGRAPGRVPCHVTLGPGWHLARQRHVGAADRHRDPLGVGVSVAL